MRRLVGSLLLLVVMVSSAQAANTHGTSSAQGELQAFFGDGFAPYVRSGCLPVVPSSSLTFAAFACTGYVRGALTDLVYVSQSAASLTLATVNGQHWIAIHRDTSSAVGGWTRRAGSHYLFQQSASQPADPSGGLVVARVTVAANVITAVQSVRPSRSPVAAALTLINVQDYGADPDEAGDDTTAILAAIAALPTADGVALTQGTGCLYFPLPRTDTGFYKVSSTLNFTEKWNGCMQAPALLTRGRSDTDAGRRALIKWYGATETDVILLHNLISFDLINISVDCRDIVGTVGIALGPRVTQSSVVKMVRGHHLEVQHCDIGIRNGDYAANGPDVASNSFSDVYVHDNVSQGIAQYSGNGLLYISDNSLLEHNGWAPTTATHGGAAAGLQIGANIYAEGGTVHVTDYVGVSGTGFTQHPTIGDFVADSAGLMLDNIWSEVGTPAVVSRGASAQTSQIKNLKHYTATMNDTTTPTSIVWQADNPLIISGYLFGKVDVQAGNSTLVIDDGVRFYAGAQHTLGLVPVFTGTAIGNQFAYAGMPSGVSRGRVAIGRPPNTTLGSSASEAPALEMTGNELRTMTAYCTKDVNGDSCSTLAVQRGGDQVGAFHFIANGYIDGSGDVKSITSGNMSKFKWSGGLAASGQPVLELKYDTASAGGQTKFVPGTILISLSHIATGTGTAPVLTLGVQRITWTSAPPTVSTWAVGDVAYNNAPVSGVPSGWMCSAAGTPGTWKALANIP